MLHSITGRVVGHEAGHVCLEVGPFAVNVSVPNSFVAKTGSELRLFTSLFIREENLVLYGFRLQSERDFFHLALRVPGVGPKLGLSLLGAAPLPDLARAICDGDVRTLQKVPGVGKKLAQRLVGDLREKAASFAQETSSAKTQAVNILVELGLETHKARRAVEEIAADHHSVNDLVDLSLKKLGGSIA